MTDVPLSSGCNALFASWLRPSDQPDPAQVQTAIDTMIGALGDLGCAGRVAQEFGDHPELAVARMGWARAVVAGMVIRCEPGREPMGAGYRPGHRSVLLDGDLARLAGDSPAVLVSEAESSPLTSQPA